MNFKEKVRHMVKVGIPKNRIIEEKTPYVAKNLLSKFGDDVAVVYIFGKKDAGRLTGGKYFQDYKFPAREGNLLLFPAHLEHKFGDNNSDEDRISVSFNLKLIDNN